MGKKLSETQQQLVTKISEYGTLVRYPGGYWSAPGVECSEAVGSRYPVWHFGTLTVRALIKQGMLVVSQMSNNGMYPIGVRLAGGLKGAWYMRETLMTRKDEGVGDGIFDSIAWLFSEHVKEPDDPAYNSAVVLGNEDAPEQIDFYREAEPLLRSVVARTWKPEPDDAQ
jgi:hypothetical protein